MSDKAKRRNSVGGKLKSMVLPSDYSDSLDSHEERAPTKYKVTTQEMSELCEAINQMRVSMELLTRGCTQVATQQAHLKTAVMQHLAYETTRDTAQLELEAEEDTFCGCAASRWFK